MNEGVIMCVCMSVSVRACVRLFVRVYAHVPMSVHVLACVRVYMGVRVCVCVCACVCAGGRSRTQRTVINVYFSTQKCVTDIFVQDFHIKESSRFYWSRALSCRYINACGDIQRYTPVTFHTTALFLNTIILFDKVVRQKRNFKHDK